MVVILEQIVAEKKGDWSYELSVSCLEIYNENIRDLLSDNPKAKLDVSETLCRSVRGRFCFGGVPLGSCSPPL